MVPLVPTMRMSVGVLPAWFEVVYPRPVKLAVPKFASGGWLPPDTEVISSIHSAESVGPL